MAAKKKMSKKKASKKTAAKKKASKKKASKKKATKTKKAAKKKATKKKATKKKATKKKATKKKATKKKVTKKKAAKTKVTPYDDWKHFFVWAELPDEPLTKSQVYRHAYGHRLNDGAKPWPYYQDAKTGEWWSLSSRGKEVIEAVARCVNLAETPSHAKLV